jgi:hypothetical protein
MLVVTIELVRGDCLISFYYLLILMARFHSDPRFGVPLFHIGPILATPVKFAGLFAVLAALLGAPPHAGALRRPNGLAPVFLIFATLPVLTSLAFGLPIPNDPISSFISFGFLFVCTRLLITTEDRLVRSVRVIVLATTLGSLWLYKQHFLSHVSRPDGIEGDCNYEALTLVMDLPLAVWMAAHEQRSIWRRIGIASTVVIGIAIVLTQSRAGLIALAAAGLTTVLYSRRKRFAFAMVSAAVLLLVTLAPSSLFARFHNIALSGAAQNGDEVSTRTHFELVKAGLNMIESHPIFGIGLDQFKTVAPQYNSNLFQVAGRSYIAHNTYVQIGAECGLPALVCFLLLLIQAMRNCRMTRRLSIPGISDLALAMQVSLIGFCIAGVSVTAEYVTALWILIVLSQNLREIALAKIGPELIAPVTFRKSPDLVASRRINRAA